MLRIQQIAAEWREKKRKAKESDERLIRAAVHRRANRAVRDGELKREPCEECYTLKTDMHHDDYSKPLDVHHLCRSCHMVKHKRA